MKFEIEGKSVQHLIDALLKVEDKSRPLVICLKEWRNNEVWDSTLITVDGINERRDLGTEIVLRQEDELYIFSCPRV